MMHFIHRIVIIISFSAESTFMCGIILKSHDKIINNELEFELIGYFIRYFLFLKCSETKLMT